MSKARDAGRILSRHEATAWPHSRSCCMLSPKSARSAFTILERERERERERARERKKNKKAAFAPRTQQRQDGGRECTCKIQLFIWNWDDRSVVRHLLRTRHSHPADGLPIHPESVSTLRRDIDLAIILFSSA